MSALFPGRDELDGIERLALSIELSICLVAFIGLVLNYTPWGFRLKPIHLSISAFTLILVAPKRVPEGADVRSKVGSKPMKLYRTISRTLFWL